jgi:hypothetical protein
MTADRFTYRSRKQLDTERYNACLEGAAKAGGYASVYAHSAYLDALFARNWGALVVGDYQQVFPLPLKRFLGIPYAVQPPFCQQLGLMGQPGPLSEKDAIKDIPSFLFRVRLWANSEHPLAEEGSRVNFVIPAGENRLENLDKDARKNIQKAREKGCVIRPMTNLNLGIETYRSAWGSLNQNLSEEDYERFLLACKSLQAIDRLHAIKALGPEGELLATAIFLKGYGRLHYVCAAPTPAGRAMGIMHLVIADTLEQFSDWELDLEGSSIDSVASFYKKFKPENRPFHFIKRGL